LSGEMDHSQSSVCLDAETMAAWVDDELAAAERVAAEQHVADCARCQAMLAALVRTTPEATSAPSWWQLPRLSWLVPLAATAVAVGIWIAVPALPPTRSSSPSESAPTSAPAAPAKTSGTPGMQEAQRKIAARNAQPDSAAASAPVSKAEAPVDRLAAPAASAPAPTPPAAPTPAPVEESARATAQAPPASSALRSETRAREQPRVELFAGAADARAGEVVSPDPMSRWRIAGGRAVQRSTDGGATWEPQQAGATSDLAAGSSPSVSVCWLVGRAGLVLLTIDGRQWRTVVFPVAVDLSAVRATDARTAVITTSDGRTFRTSDGGQTWTP